jgi:hypothetical protein
MIQATQCRASANRRLMAADALICPRKLLRKVFPPVSTSLLSNHSTIYSSIQQWLTLLPATR